MARISVDLAFTPALLAGTARPTVVVMVDVLRATSTITTFFHLGARSVSLAGSIRQCQALARAGRVVGAELNSGAQAPRCGLPISPSLLTRESVAGHDVVFRTTNGTRALRRAARESDHLLAGSLLNASSVAERAVDLASEIGGGIVIACAGRRWTRIPCLDDAYTAGYIVERVCSAADGRGVRPRLTDAARIGLAYRHSAGSPDEALAQSTTAQILRRLDREPDIQFCARPDVMPVVPTVVLNGRVERHPVMLL